MSWEDNVRKVIPYIPGEQPQTKNLIKLNTNECPYPPSPKVEKILGEMKYEDFRLYPDPNASELVDAISSYYNVPGDQIFVGVGSDDVLSMAFMTFFNSDKPVLFPDITYSFYDVWAKLYNIPYKVCPLNENLRIVTGDYYTNNGGIVLPNPNAPTGVLEDVIAIEDIIAHNRDVVVIIDEAYIDFGGKSVLPLIDKYDNLLVVQTFSKSRAMAGMRIGFAFGSKKLIKYLSDAKFSFNSYTMNIPSIKLGTASISDDEYFKSTCRKIMETRRRTKCELKALGFSFPDSQANFIFAKHENISGQSLFCALKAAGIYVRHWNAPRIEDYLRISIGTDDQMDKLIAFLKDYLK